MSALDKSLDEILSEKPKRNLNNRKRASVSKAKVGKAVSKPKGKASASAAGKATAGSKKTGASPKSSQAGSKQVIDVSYATKVNVYNLPKDIKQDAIRDFFSSEVGGVQSVALNYNEKGQSKGIATVVFKSSINASKAVEKYNGAPIDQGGKKLKLELIVDPTKKPLAARIVANAINAAAPAAKKGNAAGKAKQAGSTAGAAAGGRNKQAAKRGDNSKKQQQQKNKRPAKKSIEQLDQEMTDYFENKA
ncbi:hypothetical protein WICPIJ_000037 [Wickerhamomyces pijperi]|uniref:RRM domain-containing protein n=1 Tax=Wickerhamomyces pijperi TaxID=599730 RepID=A0A9P8QEP0_WICPI|nr:hypothetical protein WICPIJ_000037 [Wickerhamomyces pijperi]